MNIEGEDRAARTEKLARLSGACRQAGAMMEAGVDILSITRILRAQTEDADILRLCDRIDYDLKHGRALADSLAGEPEMFSPFMVTLIRQGEERSTLPQAFARVSTALEAERQELLQALPAASTRPVPVPTSTQPQASAPDAQAGPPQVLAEPSNALSGEAIARFQVRSWPEAESSLEQAEARWLRTAGSIGAGLLAASALAEVLGALGLNAKWQRPLAKALSAAVLAAAAARARRTEEAGRARPASAPQPPQVLAPGPRPEEPLAEPPRAASALESQLESQEVDAQPARYGSEARPFAPPVREARAPVAAPEEAAEPNAVYRGAPREDEEEAPRQVRRPRHEEEFD